MADIEDYTNQVSSEHATKPDLSHWSQGLLSAMKDPSVLVEEDEQIVIIKDRYPKAKYHFLILPHESIADVQALNIKHIQLLYHMEKQAKSLAERYRESTFKLGFHAIPSMAQLHMHVISQDFISPCMKNKKHWNSFTTEYFLNSADVIAMINKKGIVKVKDGIKNLLKAPLKCHKCQYVPDSMPQLKLHLQNMHG